MSTRAMAKRLLDQLGAVAVLAVTAPVLAVAGAAIRAQGDGPVLFTQERIGRDGRPFRLYKLRTMRLANDSQGRPLPDAERLTSLGTFLRATSLDELPQLINVLKGDMSLVGPRPLLPRYLPRYTPEQARRHEVTPGITGWAQVNGRNSLAWDDKFRLDVWYVDHWSLRLDARILALTALRVVKPTGISNEGSATMPEFLGANDTNEGEPK